MLTYDFNKRGNLPLYQYLYECICRDIISGQLRHGEKLPSKRSLAQHLNVGIITVVNAYERLLAEGYISAEERSGYYVSYLTRSDDYITSPVSHDAPPDLSEETEENYRVDFKANRAGIKLFPVSKWNQLMRQALSQNKDSFYKTVPYNGLKELRSAIADYLLRSRGMNISPAQIIIGAGTEYLYSRLTQMFGRACTFGFESPGYTKLADISATYGNPVEYISIDENGLRIDSLEDSGADVVHISPANHFPTGISMPLIRRTELLEWAYRAKKRYIVEDDYDSEFHYSGRFSRPLFTEDTRNKVIYINTFSKTAVPSLRIGYMVLPPALLRQYKSNQSFYSCTVSSFEQYTLAVFISEGHFERHINHLKNHYSKVRHQFLETIRSSPLGNISEVVEHNAGTHFLLIVHTSLLEDQVRQMGIEKSIRLSMYSDYGQTERTPGSVILVINYAAIAPDDISEVVSCLASIFPECGATT